MSLTRKQISYSLFAGAGLGLASYAATYYVSPAMIGAANFAAANLFAPFLGAAMGTVFGMASIAVAAAVAGAILAIALYALYKWFTNKPAQPKAKADQSLEADQDPEADLNTPKV